MRQPVIRTNVSVVPYARMVRKAHARENYLTYTVTYVVTVTFVVTVTSVVTVTFVVTGNR